MRPSLSLVSIVLFLLTGLFLCLFVDSCSTSRSRGKTIVRLRNDSTSLAGAVMRYRALADSFRRESIEVLAYATSYKTRSERADSSRRVAVKKLSYADKVTAYYRALVDNNTLIPEVVENDPELTSDEVVTAGLNTAYASARKDTTIEVLSKGLATVQAQKQALQRDLFETETKVRTMKENVALVAKRALNRKRGGIWPLNAKRRKQLTETARDIETIPVD